MRRGDKQAEGLRRSERSSALRILNTPSNKSNGVASSRCSFFIHHSDLFFSDVAFLYTTWGC